MLVDRVFVGNIVVVDILGACDGLEEDYLE